MSRGPQTPVAALLVSCHGAEARQLRIAFVSQTKAACRTEFLPRSQHRLAVASDAYAFAIDIAALGRALHASYGLRRLPKIEFESGRVLQAQIPFLKSAYLLPLGGTASAAAERRHGQARKLWDDMLSALV